MVKSFPKTLAYLRREKKISQKEAASSLGISQALLSHYENGLREPGLEFAVKAAKYYQVSTDYLLGVSGEKSGKRIEATALPDAESGMADKERGDSGIVMRKKLTINSVGMLYDAVGRLGSGVLIDETAAFVDLSLYKLFRYLSAKAEEKNSFFSVSPRDFEPLCDAEIKRTEGNIKRILREKSAGKDEKLDLPPVMDLDYLHETYPEYEQSILALLHAVGERLERLAKLSDL